MKSSRARQDWWRLCDLRGQSLTLARPFISEQFVAFLAAAFEGAHRVPAEVIAASVVLQAFVDVWVKVKVVRERDRESETTTNVRILTSIHLIPQQLQVVLVQVRSGEKEQNWQPIGSELDFKSRDQIMMHVGHMAKSKTRALVQ